MTPSRPYLLRAIHQWIVDNGFTPYIVVDAEFPGVGVPYQYVDEGGKIVLDVSPRAVRNLDLTNSAIQFTARFSGVTRDIVIPMRAILAIYAHENGRGMVFEDDMDDENGDGNDDGDGSDSPSTGADDEKGSDKSKKGKPKLSIVK